MKFIQHIPAQVVTRSIYQEVRETKETAPPLAVGAEDAEALAQLGTSAELGELSLQAVTESYWQNTDRSSVLTQVNDDMGYKRGSADRIKSFNSAVSRIANNPELKQSFAKALGLTATIEGAPLGKTRPQARPEGLVPESVETEVEPKTVVPVEPIAKTPEVVVPDAEIPAGEPHIELVQPGDGIIRVLERAGFSENDYYNHMHDLIDPKLVGGLEVGDKFSFLEDENGAVQVKIEAPRFEHPFTYTLKEGTVSAELDPPVVVAQFEN